MKVAASGSRFDIGAKRVSLGCVDARLGTIWSREDLTRRSGSSFQDPIVVAEAGLNLEGVRQPPYAGKRPSRELLAAPRGFGATAFSVIVNGA